MSPKTPPPVPPDFSWDQPTTDVREMIEKQAKVMAEAMTEANKRAEAERAFGRMQLQLAALFGIEGRPGTIAAMETRLAQVEGTQKQQGSWISELLEFKARALWIASGLLTAGGVIAAVAFKGIERLISGHW